MKLNRIVSAFLAFVMLFGTGTKVLAGDETTGTITVSNAKEGAEYKAYKIFDVTYDEENHYSYTIDGDSPWYSTVALYASNTGNGMTLTAVAGTADPIVYSVTTTDTFKAPHFASVLADALKDVPITDPEVKTLTNGKAENLELGYWFVTTTTGALCSLTTTDPTSTIYDKNIVEFEKTVDDEDHTVEAGQVLTYTITGMVPSTTGYTVYNYEVSDTMSEGLTFDGGIQVKFGDTVVFENRTGETEVTTIGTYTAGTNGFTWKTDMLNNQTYVNQPITITYKATVNEKAIERNVETNTAKLKYSNNPSDTTSTDEITDEEKVYSVNIDIIKEDANDTAKKLAGAEFVLYEERKTAESETPVKYYYRWNSTDKKVEWVTDKAQATVKTTTDNGLASFDGLDMNENETTAVYYLEETKAPSGYNPPSRPFTVTVTKVTDETTKAVSFSAAVNDGTGAKNAAVTNTSNSVQAVILNASGSILPGTGGIGTHVFYAAGGILLVGALLLLITNSRMHIKAAAKK